MPSAKQTDCPLAGYRIPCAGPPQLHHIIPLAWARGNKKVRAILIQNPPEITGLICAAHNTSKWADTPEARAILLRRKTDEFGMDRLAEFVDELPWKTPRTEWKLQQLLSYQI